MGGREGRRERVKPKGVSERGDWVSIRNPGVAVTFLGLGQEQQACRAGAGGLCPPTTTRRPHTLWSPFSCGCLLFLSPCFSASPRVGVTRVTANPGDSLR